MPPPTRRHPWPFLTFLLPLPKPANMPPVVIKMQSRNCITEFGYETVSGCHVTFTDDLFAAAADIAADVAELLDKADRVLHRAADLAKLDASAFRIVVDYHAAHTAGRGAAGMSHVIQQGITWVWQNMLRAQRELIRDDLLRFNLNIILAALDIAAAESAPRTAEPRSGRRPHGASDAGTARRPRSCCGESRSWRSLVNETTKCLLSMGLKPYQHDVLADCRNAWLEVAHRRMGVMRISCLISPSFCAPLPFRQRAFGSGFRGQPIKCCAPLRDLRTPARRLEGSDEQEIKAISASFADDRGA